MRREKRRTIIQENTNKQMNSNKKERKQNALRDSNSQPSVEKKVGSVGMMRSCISPPLYLLIQCSFSGLNT